MKVTKNQFAVSAVIVCVHILFLFTYAKIEYVRRLAYERIYQKIEYVGLGLRYLSPSLGVCVRVSRLAGVSRACAQELNLPITGQCGVWCC